MQRSVERNSPKLLSNTCGLRCVSGRGFAWSPPSAVRARNSVRSSWFKAAQLSSFAKPKGTAKNGRISAMSLHPRHCSRAVTGDEPVRAQRARQNRHCIADLERKVGALPFLCPHLAVVERDHELA